MRTSDFGFRSMSFAAAIVSACFVFSSCSKENIQPSTSTQVSEDAAARKAPISIFKKKIIVCNPDVKPGIRKDDGIVKLSDYKIDINNNTSSGRESASDEIKTDGMGGMGRSIRERSNIENGAQTTTRAFHPRNANPRTDRKKMEVLRDEVLTDES